MNLPTNLDALSPNELCTLAAQLMAQVSEKDRELRYRQARIDRLTHELAIHEHWESDKRSEQLTSEQASLLDEVIDAGLEAIETGLEAPLSLPKSEAKSKPRCQALPPQLPRTDTCHESDAETRICGYALKRIGEDISGRLDYTPGTFTAERHIRGRWVCDQCETLVQTPVPPHVISKGISTVGLLAYTLVSKFDDHLPLHQQERIYACADLVIPQSTLGAWVGICGVRLQPLVDALQGEVLSHDVLHVDETPAQMLTPGNGKTHRVYLWVYAPSEFEEMCAVIYQSVPSRSGEHAHAFLGQWQGELACDGFAGYKASSDGGVTEIGYMAHSRRKFFELYDKHKSELAGQALRYTVSLYEIEAQVRDTEPDQRLAAWQQRVGPILERPHTWLEK